jgi:hypothetical protein
MVAIRPTYWNKISSVTMRVMAIGKFLSSDGKSQSGIMFLHGGTAIL